MAGKTFAVTALVAVCGVVLGLALTRSARLDDTAILTSAGLTAVSYEVPPPRLTERQTAILTSLRRDGTLPSDSTPLERPTWREWESVRQVERMTTYRGTQISESSAVALRHPEESKAIAAAILKRDLAPPARRRHFAWCLENPKFN